MRRLRNILKNERFLDISYMAGTVIVQIGAVTQIHRTYATKSVEDIAIMWIILLLIGQVLHIPRCFSSGFWVWKGSHVASCILVGVLLIGVILYR